MKKPLIFILVLGVIFGVLGYVFSSGILNPDEKLYIAAEGDGKIAVLDTAKKKVIKTIDLSVDHEGGRLMFAPHNVQVAPDGKSVWVTANSGMHIEGSAHSFISQAHAHGANVLPDEVIVICLSGRGDKDAAEIARVRGEEY